MLFNKGDPSKAAYIVLQGTIDVILTRQADAKLPKMYDNKGVVASMKTGQLFGEIGLNRPDSVRTATCVARCHSFLAVIEKTYWTLLDKESSGASEVARDLATLYLAAGFRQLSKDELVKIYDLSDKIFIPSDTIVFD